MKGPCRLILGMMLCISSLVLYKASLKMSLWSMNHETDQGLPRYRVPCLAAYLVNAPLTKLFTRPFYALFLDINRISLMRKLETFEKRILLVSASENPSRLYLEMMNAIFSAQKNVLHLLILCILFMSIVPRTLSLIASNLATKSRPFYNRHPFSREDAIHT